MSVVVFDPNLFIARYPQFASTDPGLLLMYFGDATDLINNTDCSPVPDLPEQGGTRTRILMAATAHIAILNGAADGMASSGLVGRVTSATQGSVSVSAETGVTSQSAQYWLQTAPGYMVWQALAPYRTALYIGKPARNMNPFGATPGGYGGYYSNLDRRA